MSIEPRHPPSQFAAKLRHALGGRAGWKGFFVQIVFVAAVVWIGYLSTTGVYGDRGGAWVDEDVAPMPGSARAARRVAAEQAWREAASGRPLDIFRLAGIYGPGRSAFDTLRDGTARRIVKPGHGFGRIHRDDIAVAVLAAMRQQRASADRSMK